MPYKKRWAHVIFGAGILALAAAGVCLADYWQADRALAAKTSAEPFRLAVDLSTKGQYHGDVDETHQGFGQDFWLEVNPPFASASELDKALEGFRGKARIIDASEKVRQQVELVPMVRHGWGDGAHMLWNPEIDRTPAIGQYNIVVEVTDPADQLAGHQQVMYGRYEITEFESIRAFGRLAASVGSGIVALGSITAGWIAGRRPE